MRFWIGVFGQPQHGLLFDNGGEFSNIQMHNLCEKLNIQIKTTAAYSPFSNGCLERHNATITNIYEKVRMDHPTLDLDTCLAYACFAKNNLYNNSGFTPAQIALGYSPRLPCNVENELPALDDKLDMSTVVGNHLSAMHSARTQYLKSESCERVRRALRHNVRATKGPFEINDLVYYRRSIDSKWHGPAKVIGVDGQLVFVRIGGQIARIHKSDLQKVKHSNDSTVESITDQNLLHQKVNEGLQRTVSAEDGHEFPITDHLGDNLGSTQMHDYQPCSTQQHRQSLTVTDDLACSETELPIDDDNGLTDTNTSPTLEEPISKQQKRPKRGEILEFSMNDADRADGGSLYRGKVVNLAGKSGGKYNMCVNVRYDCPLAGKTGYIDLDREVT